MLSCRVDGVQVTEQLGVGFVSNLLCTAHSFNCFKSRWFPDPQVREAVMSAGRSQIRLTAALLEWMQKWWMHALASQLWASSSPAAMGRWQQVLSCPLLIKGAHNRSFKQWEEAEALCSLHVPVLPWAHSLWVGGQHLELHCLMIHCSGLAALPSDICPLHRLHGQGISRNVYFPFCFGPIKAIMVSARLFILVFLG